MIKWDAMDVAMVVIAVGLFVLLPLAVTAAVIWGPR